MARWMIVSRSTWTLGDSSSPSRSLAEVGGVVLVSPRATHRVGVTKGLSYIPVFGPQRPFLTQAV